MFTETRQQSRFAGFSLYVSDIDNTQNYSLCYKDGPMLPPLNFTTICSMLGRYFIYKNQRLQGITYPSSYNNPYTELCEVIVQGTIFKRVKILEIFWCFDMLNNSVSLYPRTRSLGGILESPCPSVSLSVYPSVCRRDSTFGFSLLHGIVSKFVYVLNTIWR